MHAMLCDACNQPVVGEGIEVSMLRGTVVRSPDEPPRLAATEGILAATLCSRCGERLGAIVQRKLEDPCPVCEVAPLREGDRRAAQRAALRSTVRPELRRAG
ncbi:MAG: hypothetical protein AB7F65_11730 [Dehalococcoidia bacterium]